jgi:redox-sensitive bicupin YhaK (pirin superfamily)
MTKRSVKQLIQAMAVSEGAGVTVHRTIGTPALRNLDPFLMMDHFSSDDPDDYIAGFPDHPHRGFNTFTYMLDGHMLHQDSMGNRGDLRAGGAQWMKAASGVIHSEMPQQSEGMMRGFQLWVNLPANEKMSAPAYQEFPSDAMPVIDSDEHRVKVLVGEFQGQRGPVNDPYTGVQYFDVTLKAGKTFTHDLDARLQAFVYVFEGDAKIGDTELPQHTFTVLGDGNTLEINAGNNDARFILVAGQPLNEPIVQYGPFVMTTQEDIQQAFIDYREGTLVRDKASFVTT